MEARRLELIATSGSTPSRISRGTLKAPHPAAEAPTIQPDRIPTRAIIGNKAVISSLRRQKDFVGPMPPQLLNEALQGRLHALRVHRELGSGNLRRVFGAGDTSSRWVLDVAHALLHREVEHPQRAPRGPRKSKSVDADQALPRLQETDGRPGGGAFRDPRDDRLRP